MIQPMKGLVMNTHTLCKYLNVIIFTVTLLAAGCAKQEKIKLSVNDNFRPDDEPRSVDAIWRQQTANAARADGTLYAHHFTGAALNGLGKQKIDSAFYGPDAGKVALYIDVAKDVTYGAREQSVLDYLTHKGLAAEAYTVTAGPNLTAGTPAAQGLKALESQNSGTTESASPTAAK
jgi:hypothetical protein